MRGKRIGFSMLEVVLVMGLAGMIFLMAFLLVPQLQRNQRDEARRDDVMQLVQNLQKFQTNNRGVLPKGTTGVASRPIADQGTKYNTWAGFYHDYVSEAFYDPDGSSYILVPAECKGSNRGDKCDYSTVVNIETGEGTSAGSVKIEDALNNLDHHLVIFWHASCTEDYASYADNPRSFAVVTRLESAGTYCFGA